MKKELKEKIENRLKIIYNDSKKEREAAEKLEEYLSEYGEKDEKNTGLSERDSILITYGDTIFEEGTPGLESLGKFLERFVGNAIESIHLLPMYPYTSDDGFSVTDYREINPELGTWEHIRELSGS